MKTMRKGAVVRYIGSDEIAKGQTFTVKKKTGNWIEVMWPVKYLDGSIHGSRCDRPIEDFELI